MSPDGCRVVKLACLSRLFCLALVWLADLQMDDARNGIVGIRGGSFIGGLVQWDGIHFLNIALRGYDSVLSHAFFPGLPMVMRMGYLVHNFLVPITDEAAMAFWLAVWGLVFVQVSFVLSALGLYNLSLHVQQHKMVPGIDPFRSTLFYIFGAANVFHSALYTESPFCMFTFWGILWLLEGRIERATLAFAAATLFRSNGLLMIGFVLVWLIISARTYTGLVAAGCIYLPYYLYSKWSTNLFCPESSWCAERSIYAHVQKTFWHVDFLTYWKWDNRGFFLLLIPALVVAIHSPIHFLINLKRSQISIYMCFLTQMGILTFFVVFIANCQILTRLLTSCPLYFWTLDRVTKQSGSIVLRRLGRCIFGLNFAYFLAGPIIFSNGFNWT